MQINDILAEQSHAPLYHTTTVDAAIKIIKSGKIIGAYDNADRVSMSRDKLYAHNRYTKGRNKFGPVVFHIDQEKLKHNHRVKAGNPVPGLYSNPGFSQSWTDNVPLNCVTHISLEQNEVSYKKQEAIRQALQDAGYEHIDVIEHLDHVTRDEYHREDRDQRMADLGYEYNTYDGKYYNDDGEEYDPNEFIEERRNAFIERKLKLEVLQENLVYLEEQTRATLYHATSLKNLKNIIKDGEIKIKGYEYYPEGIYTISTTRNLHSAQSVWFQNAFGPFILYINQDALRYNTKITPFNYGGLASEAEEEVHDNIDLKYVFCVSIPSNYEYDEHAYQIGKRLRDSGYNHINIKRHRVNSYDPFLERYKEIEDDEYYKKYLEEQARAPLYHVTSKKNATNIVKDGIIRAFTGNNDTVSTTRMLDYAKGNKMRWRFGPVIFHINQDTVKYHKKIKTHNIFGDHSRRHAEERVDGHIPVDHVTHISYPKGEIHDLDAHEMQVLLKNTPFENIKVIRHRATTNIPDIPGITST